MDLTNSNDRQPHAFINLLPVELLQYIFSLTANTGLEHPADNKILFKLIHVCRYWHHAAISASSLWSYLTSGSGGAAWYNRAWRSMERAKLSNLDICVAYPDDVRNELPLNNFIHLVVSREEQWRKLVVLPLRGHVPKLLLWSKLDAVRLTNLRIVECYGEESLEIWGTISTIARSLTSVTLAQMNVDMRTLPLRLERLKLDTQYLQRMDYVMHQLGTLRLLQSLHITCSFSPDDYHGSGTGRISASLPSLRALSLTMSERSHETLVIRLLDCPNVRSLRLQYFPGYACHICPCTPWTQSYLADDVARAVVQKGWSLHTLVLGWTITDRTIQILQHQSLSGLLRMAIYSMRLAPFAAVHMPFAGAELAPVRSSFRLDELTIGGTHSTPLLKSMYDRAPYLLSHLRRLFTPDSDEPERAMWLADNDAAGTIQESLRDVDIYHCWPDWATV